MCPKIEIQNSINSVYYQLTNTAILQMQNNQQEIASATLMVLNRMKNCRDFGLMYREQIGQSVCAYNDLFKNFPLDRQNHDVERKIREIKLFAEQLEDENSHVFDLMENDHLSNAISNWSEFQKLFELLKNLKYNELQHAQNIGLLSQITQINPIRLPFLCFQLTITNIKNLILRLQASESILKQKRESQHAIWKKYGSDGLILPTMNLEFYINFS